MVAVMRKKQNGEFSVFVIIRWLMLLVLSVLCCRLLVTELQKRAGVHGAADSCWYEDGSDTGAISQTGEAIEVSAGGNYIKWVEFHATCEAMSAAYELDVATYEDEVHLDWIELLAYVGAKHGGRFDKNSVKEINETAGLLTGKETTIQELTKDMEYYDYYLEAYHAILDGMVGEFSLEVKGDAEAAKAAENVTADTKVKGADDAGKWKRYYGLKAFSPIAKGFDYSHYDDFGSSRSYGYSRPHLGHDMMGMIGTPIRIKDRTCASKNDAQALIFQNTFLDNLTNQFIFSGILNLIEIIKQVADIIVNFLLRFLQGFLRGFPQLALS